MTLRRLVAMSLVVVFIGLCTGLAAGSWAEEAGANSASPAGPRQTTPDEPQVLVAASEVTAPSKQGTGIPAPPAAAQSPDQGPGRPSDSLSNPVTDPTGSIDDAQAARRFGWPALVFAIGTMLAIGLAYLGRKYPSVKALAWLDKGVVATTIGFVGACGAAGFDAAVGGGSWAAMGFAVLMGAMAFWQARRGSQVQSQPDQRPGS